jgi:hypothetical protein
MALMLPWYIFLFVGTFDWGYYAHALISTESAARVAAQYTSTSASTAADSAGACAYALDELRIVPNIGSGLATCAASPVVVTATLLKTGQGTTADNNYSSASQVGVTYTTMQLIPIPGLLSSGFTFYRVVQMRLRS